MNVNERRLARILFRLDRTIVQRRLYPELKSPEALATKVQEIVDAERSNIQIAETTENPRINDLLLFLEEEIIGDKRFDMVGFWQRLDRLVKKIREVCLHIMPNGDCAWLDGMDSQCAVCHSRD